MFNPIPSNQMLPFDLCMKKVVSFSGKLILAPAIIVRDESWHGNYDVEQRKIEYGTELFIDITAENNSYLLIKDRKVTLYQVEKDKVVEDECWHKVKTISGKDYSAMGSAYPGMETWTQESFVLTLQEDKEYYIIAHLEKEGSEVQTTPRVRDEFDINRLNESYYWSVLDTARTEIVR